MNEAILQLAETIGIAANKIVGHYVYWFVIKAWVWLLVAASLAVFPYTRVFKEYYFSAYPSSDRAEKDLLIIRAVLGLIVILIITENVPDLLAPTAISIHQLLEDVTP